MATIDTADSNGGGLLRLWRDKEARGVIIQILTIAILFGLFFYLGWNAQQNLAAIDKDLGFAFLGQPASYDINQTLIDYNSRDPHIRAAVVGVLNTLLIAVCGIILATVLGFVLGVLRLSRNVLINKIAYVYVEVVRNVPVLLFILLVHGLVVDMLPQPRAAATEGWDIAGVAFLSNRGFYLPSAQYQPLFWATVIVFLIGIAFSIGFARYAKKLQAATGKILPVFWTSVGAIVGAPILVFLITGMPIEWSVPELSGFNFQGGFAIKPEFLALWLALSLYTAAFIAEIVRAGILAVNYGQTEAAHALGLKHNRTLQLIIVPQALRVIVPPLTSQYLNLTKNSSLAIAIGYMDIVATIGGITLNQTGREMECMAIVLLLYLTFSLIISTIMNGFNKAIKLVER
jgi:general L-amino acid transport system permease protein